MPLLLTVSLLLPPFLEHKQLISIVFAVIWQASYCRCEAIWLAEQLCLIQHVSMSWGLLIALGVFTPLQLSLSLTLICFLFSFLFPPHILILHSFLLSTSLHFLSLTHLRLNLFSFSLLTSWSMMMLEPRGVFLFASEVSVKSEMLYCQIIQLYL